VSARAAGAVAMYVPSAREWTHGAGFFSAVPADAKDPVLDGPAAVRWYDRPTQTLACLAGLLEAHGDALAAVPCAVESEARAEAGAKTVRDLVEFGVAALRDVDADWRTNPRRGGDALDAVVRELCAQTALPFMLAIDDYGSLLGMADLVSGDARCVHAGGIRAVAQLFGRDALPRTVAALQNGVVMLALSSSHGAPRRRPSRVQGTVDFPVTEGVRRDPTGAKWLAHAREMGARLAAGVAPTDLLDEDAALNPTAVSAAAFATCGVRFFDVPGWTASEAAGVLAEFQDEKRLRRLEAAERLRVCELAGGRADLLHKLCMAH
jgi:hypothetical protein